MYTILFQEKKRRLKLQYHRNKYKNYQRKNGKSALVTDEGASVNTWAGFPMVLKGT